MFLELRGSGGTCATLRTYYASLAPDSRKSFHSVSEALDYLRTLQIGTMEAQRLRALLAEAAPHDASLADTQQLLERVARLLALRSWELLETAPYGQAGGGAAADIAPPPPPPPPKRAPVSAAPPLPPPIRTQRASPQAEQPAVSDDTWIEIELRGEDGKPIANAAYLLITPDGRELRGHTDAAGLARHEGLAPGACQLTFTELDEEAWDHAA